MRVKDPDDRDGQTCTKCGVGYYTETSIHDDWDGLLHCTNKNCNHEVKRYKSEDEPKPKSMEQTALSSEAQAVLDAYFTHADLLNREVSHEEMLAAALRAAADQLDHATSAHTLYAIADELEAQ